MNSLKNSTRMILAACALIGSTALASSAPTTPAYRLAKTVALGAPDRWDYVVADAPTGRVYVAHGDRLTVLDSRSGAIVGEVVGMPGGAHGTAISAATGQGFTDDGEKGEVVAFDLKTLKVVRRIPAAADADGIACDPVTGRVLVVEGDPGTLTLIDPATEQAVATVSAGEKMEYPAADGSGRIFIAGEEKSDLVVVDARTAQVIGHWPTPDCAKPHGLTVDPSSHRAFIGCVNAKMMVVDTGSGRVVAELPIGLGNDAISFDPGRRRLFSSNGRDGTVSVYQQLSPDSYHALPTIQTTVSARTMAVDPRSGRLFVAGADTDPNATPGGRPHVRPGTLRMMVYDPVG